MTTIKTKELRAKTVVMLLAIADAVLADPKNYDQSEFYKDGVGCLALFHSKLTASPRALALRIKLTGNGEICFHPERNVLFRAAKRDLGLNDFQADRLFSAVWLWPEKFRFAYLEAKGPKGRARVAAKRIKHFIRTNGAE